MEKGRQAVNATRLVLVGLLGLAAAACAPASAHQAQQQLHTTAQSADAASRSAAAESRQMGAVVTDIRLDVRNIKDVEAWFDRQRPISFD